MTIAIATTGAAAVETKAPTMFMTAAMATAMRGESARVETEVAMALAVSWKPLVKSNASAMTTIVTSSAIQVSRASGRCSR